MMMTNDRHGAPGARTRRTIAVVARYAHPGLLVMHLSVSGSSTPDDALDPAGFDGSRRVAVSMN